MAWLLLWVPGAVGGVLYESGQLDVAQLTVVATAGPLVGLGLLVMGRRSGCPFCGRWFGRRVGPEPEGDVAVARYQCRGCRGRWTRDSVRGVRVER